MGNKRMFSKTITSNGVFMNLSSGAKALYFMIGMETDDDGAVSNPSAIARSCKITNKCLKELLEKRYLLPVEGDCVLVKHHLVNNSTPPSKYRPSSYINIIKQKYKVDDRGFYTEIDKKMVDKTAGNLPAKCQQKAEKSLPNKNITKQEHNKNITRSSSKECVAVCDRQSVYTELDRLIPLVNTSFVVAVDQYLDKLPAEVVLQAIKATADANKRDARYFKAIAQRYYDNGYKTAQEVLDADAEFRNKKQKSLELKDKAREVYINKNMPKAAKVAKDFNDAKEWAKKLTGGDNG